MQNLTLVHFSYEISIKMRSPCFSLRRHTAGAPLKSHPIRVSSSPDTLHHRGGKKVGKALLTFSGCPVRAGQKQGDPNDNPSGSFSPQIHDEERREGAQEPGCSWRRETANLPSPAPREISSNPTGGRKGGREIGREREKVVPRCVQSANFSAPPPLLPSPKQGPN